MSTAMHMMDAYSTSARGAAVRAKPFARCCNTCICHTRSVEAKRDHDAPQMRCLACGVPPEVHADWQECAQGVQCSAVRGLWSEKTSNAVPDLKVRQKHSAVCVDENQQRSLECPTR